MLGWGWGSGDTLRALGARGHEGGEEPFQYLACRLPISRSSPLSCVWHGSWMGATLCGNGRQLWRVDDALRPYCWNTWSGGAIDCAGAQEFTSVHDGADGGCLCGACL